MGFETIRGVAESLRGTLVPLAAWLPLGACSFADVEVRCGYSPLDTGFAFSEVPLPADNDAATSARFMLVDGVADGNGAGLEALHDGRVPSGEDQPSANFFFRAGSEGGRVLVDLGRPVPVKQICTYSWHAGARGPQVYALYASDGKPAGFAAGPKRGTDPHTCGWRLIAQVDSRRKGSAGGGQHGVSVKGAAGALGAFRYVLLDLLPTERDDPFGNTFFSEIDVIAADGPAPTTRVVPVQRSQVAFEAEGGAYRFVVDTTEAADLGVWAQSTLRPAVQTWYPKLAALLASDGYQAPRDLVMRFRTDMGGTPASAGGGFINLNAAWFRRELEREACGAVIHELVHVVQGYGRAKKAGAAPQPVPGWVVEGIADYVRWFLYEPQTRGAEIAKQSLDKVRYDGSYRVSANFLDWATRTYGEELVRNLNAAAREGRYEEALWKAWTGQSVQALGEAWKRSLTGR